MKSIHTPRGRTSQGRRDLLIGLVAFVGFALVACATVKINQRIKSGALARQLIFPHSVHVENADCADCHKGIKESTGPTLGKYIGKGKHGGCVACHEDEVKKKCEMCHVKGQDKKVELTRINRMVNFSHAAHQPRVQQALAAKTPVGKDGKKVDAKKLVTCKQCHAAAYKTKKAGTPMLGKMAVCTDACHKKDIKDQACDKCHTQLTRQRLEAVLHLGHQGNFLKRHGTLARNSAERCAQCHDQTYCADCHGRTSSMPLSIRYPEKINNRYIHRGDFIGRHMVQARAQPTTCKKCHGNQYCTTCHEMRGVVRPAPTAVGSKVRAVHGAQWMTPGQAGFHGREARRNAARCASCHDQGAASNCVKCHKVGALGGSPHPRNFKWANKSGECKANPMCLTCHVNGMGCR